MFVFALLALCLTLIVFNVHLTSQANKRKERRLEELKTEHSLLKTVIEEFLSPAPKSPEHEAFLQKLINETLSPKSNENPKP